MQHEADRNVVLGLSGGVDSSVAARLLQEQGYRVTGLFLDIGQPGPRADAEAAASRLKLPLEIADIRTSLEASVCAPFADAYRRGETPNPCILCNPAVKFRLLSETADRLNARWIATGHYARAEQGRLFQGQSSNDQSYMLCRLFPEQVQRLLLPLGPYRKTEVRALAERLSLPAAHKPDSMEICFIPDHDHLSWLEARGNMPGSGPILFRDSEIGIHAGLYRYTVGQRLPGLYEGRKLYVGALDPQANAVRAVLWEDLFRTEFRVRALQWLIDPPDGPLRASVRVRHTKWEMPECTVQPEAEPDTALIRCDLPVRAPAPGQAAALYQGDQVIGGGWILPAGNV